MEDLYKIIALCLTFAGIITFLKKVNPDFVLPVSIACGALVLIFVLSYVKDFISFLNRVAEIGNVDDGIFKIIFKVIAISYLAEFSSGIAEETGQKSLGDKISFASKAITLSLSLPLLEKVIETAVGILR